ncbi:MAG: DUF4287 domain-containing protein [Ignavibacteriaceae bacterium]|nr:DUF4287 domain-containing protein [Ignavibacteriaceae bacterium]
MNKIKNYRYALHPVVEYQLTMAENLKKNTGRTLEEWLSVTADIKGVKTGEFVKIVKERFGLGMNTAVVIAAAHSGQLGADAYKPAKLIEDLFAGRQNLLEILYSILDFAVTLGSDVKICPATTFIPLYRKNVFLQIKPATGTRIDLGFALGDYPLRENLTDTGGLKKKDRITRKIELFSVDDLNDFVKLLIKTAYEMS